MRVHEDFEPPRNTAMPSAVVFKTASKREDGQLPRIGSMVGRPRRWARRLYRNLRCVVDSLRGPLPHPEKWVFIVGCYNSGTTLLHKLLAEHPSIGSMSSEGQFYTDQLLLPQNVGRARAWALEPELFYLGEDQERDIDVERIKRQWGANYNDPHKPVLVEKSPTNAARVRWLQRHFENAYFIGIVRNGYAVAEGIRRKAGWSLEEAAEQWRRANHIMLRDFDYLERRLLVRYERLTDSPRAVMQEIFEFLDLQTMEFEIRDKIWKIHESAAAIRNMNERSFQVLTRGDKRVIEEVCGDMLTTLGYWQGFDISRRILTRRSRSQKAVSD